MHYGLDEAYKRFKKAVTTHNMICDEQAIQAEKTALCCYIY